VRTPAAVTSIGVNTPDDDPVGADGSCGRGMLGSASLTV
jgi:hypothetical protein